ncbi:MAG: hypothetical protein EBS64_08685 [Verrucomicrobia bacterium]|nr:hypothetical protein [Verrucomicrobiota bacterium]
MSYLSSTDHDEFPGTESSRHEVIAVILALGCPLGGDLPVEAVVRDHAASTVADGKPGLGGESLQRR